MPGQESSGNDHRGGLPGGPGSILLKRFCDNPSLYYQAVFPFGSHEKLGPLGAESFFNRYVAVPLFVLLSPILVPLRLLVIVVAFLLASTLSSLICLGTDGSQPLSPLRWRLLTLMLDALSNLCLTVLGIRLRVHGAEKLAKHRPDVVVMNHTSVLDLFLLVAVCPGSPIAKDSVLKIGVVRSILLALRGLTVSRERQSGHVPGASPGESPSPALSEATLNLVSDVILEGGGNKAGAANGRGGESENSTAAASPSASTNTRSTYDLMRARVAARKNPGEQGNWPHILIFPEGTTKLETALLRFHTSVFRLMLEEGATVLPVAVRIQGVRRLGYATSKIHEHLLSLLLNPWGVADVFFMDAVAADWNTNALAAGARSASSLVAEHGTARPVEKDAGRELGRDTSGSASRAGPSPREAADAVGVAMAGKIGVPYLPYTNEDSFWFFGVKKTPKVTKDYEETFMALGTERELRERAKRAPLTGITLPKDWRSGGCAGGRASGGSTKDLGKRENKGSAPLASGLARQGGASA